MLKRSTAGADAPVAAVARRPLTLGDVGRLAGVSSATASMALADHPRISVKTKEAVRRAAEQLDYVPNSLGRGLRAKRLDTIALVVPLASHHVFTHPYFMEVLDGISEVANANGLTLLVSTAPGRDGGDSAYLKLLRGRKADGVIVAAAATADRNVDRLAESGYPVVFLGRYPHDRLVPAVGVDDHGGAVAAIQHLIEVHGRRRIGHISLSPDHTAGHDRFSGYQAALAAHGIAFDARLVADGDASQASGETACTSLIAARAEFDALFVGNDEMAVGAFRALRRARISVPDGVAIIGFDDIDLASVLQPALTTVWQPMRETARVAAVRLLDLLAGRLPEPRQLELPTRLRIRQSCGCAEADADGVS